MAIVKRCFYRRIAAVAALALLVAGQAASAFAQPAWRGGGFQQRPHLQRDFPRQEPGGGRMSREDRERLRDDLGSARREVYRDPRERPRDPRMRPDEPRRLSPEERDRLRRDLEDANRGMRPRR